MLNINSDSASSSPVKILNPNQERDSALILVGAMGLTCTAIIAIFMTVIFAQTTHGFHQLNADFNISASVTSSILGLFALYSAIPISIALRSKLIHHYRTKRSPLTTK